MVTFIFEFDKPDKKYIAGETVQCKLVIYVSSNFKARSLSIRFKGVAHTEWTVSKHQRTGNEEYFNSYQYLIGSEHSDEQTIMEGTYTYNAAVKLPDNCPANIEYSIGHIRYTVKAKYDIAWAMDYTEKVSFSVTPKIDLNDFENLQRPIRQAEETVFNGCCFESDPMQLINILPKGGFVVGETIPITIEVDNNSDVRIDFVRVKLKEKITFTVNDPRIDTRVWTNTVNTHFFRTAVAAFQKKQFDTTFYLDPSYDYKLFGSCRIIKCEYYIKSEGEAAGCHSNPENSTPITIGTIPFTDVVTNGNNNSITPTILAPSAPPIGFNPVLPTNGVIVDQQLPSYNDISVAGPSSNGPRWNMGLRSPSGAPLASTEKIYFDDGLPPPSFEDSRKSSLGISGTATPVETIPSAPSEPTASATAPPE